MLFDTLLSPGAALINRGIDENETAQDLCDALEGRSLRITVKPLPSPILISASGGRVDVSADKIKEADAEITGTIIELNRLMFIDNEAPIREGRVDISGDAEIADSFRELLLSARPDLEEKLADWFGESMAFQLSSLVRDTRDWATDIAEDLTERAADFLHKDDGPLPTTAEIKAHTAEVDTLVNDVERMEARLDQLAGKRPA